MAKKVSKASKKNTFDQDYDRWSTVTGTTFALAPGQKLTTPRAKDIGTENDPRLKAAREAKAAAEKKKK